MTDTLIPRPELADAARLLEEWAHQNPHTELGRAIASVLDTLPADVRNPLPTEPGTVIVAGGVRFFLTDRASDGARWIASDGQWFTDAFFDHGWREVSDAPPFKLTRFAAEALGRDIVKHIGWELIAQPQLALAIGDRLFAVVNELIAQSAETVTD